MEKNERGKAILFIMVQSILISLSNPMAKRAYATASVLSILSVRYWLALLLLLLFFGKRILRGLRGCDVKSLLLPAACNAFAFLFSNMSLRLLKATSASFLCSTSAVFTPLLAWAILRRPYSLKHLPVLALMLAGLYLLCSPGGALTLGTGELFALSYALLTACTLVFSKKALAQADALTVTVVQTAASAILTTICAVGFEGSVNLAGATPYCLAVIVYLAVATTIASYLLQNRALKTLSPGDVALLQGLRPVLTAFLSFLMLGERLSTAGIIGAVIIIACVTVENSGRIR